MCQVTGSEPWEAASRSREHVRLRVALLRNRVLAFEGRHRIVSQVVMFRVSQLEIISLSGFIYRM